MSTVKLKYIKTLIQFVKANKKFPTKSELPMSKDALRHYFGNISGMQKQLAPLVTDHIFDVSNLETDKKRIAKYKRFVLTTAVSGDKANIKLLANMKQYCKDENALLIILPTQGASKHWFLDTILNKEVFINTDVKLNSNITILGMASSAMKVDPTTGLPRIGQRNGTFIVASPKQRLKYVATGMDKLAHALVSTGAITSPNYLSSYNVLSNQRAYMSNHDHVLGGLIVELDKDDKFYFRQIQSDRNGTFIDLGTMYYKGKRKQIAPDALVLGDWHAGKTSPIARKVWEAITKTLSIKRWVMHDVFDGDSISHHKIGKNLLLAMQAEEKRNNVKDELAILAKDLNEVSKIVDEVIIVKSNHDEHLDRYLNESRYVTDSVNHIYSLKLAQAMTKGINPVRYAVEDLLNKKLKNVRWLARDEDYSIGGIQLGAHGDKGANGTRGSITALENAYGNVVFGHAHTPQILRGAWCVGTSTDPRPDYGDGPSSWMQTSCLVYSNGQRQMINCIDGKYTTRKL